MSLLLTAGCLMGHNIFGMERRYDERYEWIDENDLHAAGVPTASELKLIEQRRLNSNDWQRLNENTMLAIKKNGLFRIAESSFKTWPILSFSDFDAERNLYVDDEIFGEAIAS